MKTNKYIFCGGEDLGVIYSGEGISIVGKNSFKRWAIKSLADSCRQEKETFLDMPVSCERRLFIRAFRECNKGSRTLTWYVGIEYTKNEIKVASCYANLVRGILELSLESLKSSRDGMDLSFNLQYPSGLPQIQTPFEDLKGKNFYGEYPRILWEFCQKISLNDIDNWFERLFLAVNVEVADTAYTNIVGNVPPKEDNPPPQEPSSFVPISQETVPRPAKRNFKKTENSPTRLIKKIFLYLWLILTFSAVLWGFYLRRELLNIKQNQICYEDVQELQTTIAEKDRKIQSLEAKIATLSAPKDIEKTLRHLEIKIRDIEKLLNDINNTGHVLNGLKQHLHELKKECRIFSHKKKKTIPEILKDFASKRY